MMPGLHGLDLAKQLAVQCPETRILVLSMHSAESSVAKAFKAGATGYVLKDAGADKLMAGIRRVASGRSFISTGPPKRAASEFPELDPGGCR